MDWGTSVMNSNIRKGSIIPILNITTITTLPPISIMAYPNYSTITNTRSSLKLSSTSKKPTTAPVDSRSPTTMKTPRPSKCFSSLSSMLSIRTIIPISRTALWRKTKTYTTFASIRRGMLSRTRIWPSRIDIRKKPTNLPSTSFGCCSTSCRKTSTVSCRKKKTGKSNKNSSTSIDSGWRNRSWATVSYTPEVAQKKPQSFRTSR